MSILKKERKKTWDEKAKKVCNCFHRCSKEDIFPSKFYENLFYLNPKIKRYFKNTDWEHQEKALMHALDHLINFLETPENQFHKSQIVRIAKTHSKKNLNIHPHEYYYWIDALIITFKEIDPMWFKDLEFYLRECLFFPVSFIISFYHKD